MRRRTAVLGLAVAGALLAAAFDAEGQLGSNFSLIRNHPAIDYASRPVRDPLSRLIARVQRGEVSLTYEPQHGYLRSILDSLDVDPESQVLVFSKTSFQSSLIGPATPRALYFNDAVAVGFVQHAPYLEFTAQDPEQGTIFYTLRQRAEGPPEFERNDSCLSCHATEATQEVPGLFATSVFPTPAGTVMYAPIYYTDHRRPLPLRWGGWYVSGTHGDARHQGNATVPVGAADISLTRTETNQNQRTLDALFDTSPYLRPGSDIVALMVLDHQMHMTNLITRLGWEARVRQHAGDGPAIVMPTPADASESLIAATRVTRPQQLALRDVDKAVVDLVDYMLFVDEPPLGPIAGTSAFTRTFPAGGPHDAQGRSLRDLSLDGRLMRYPCSYMIYSDAFDALPTPVRDAVYARLWHVLSGGETGAPYDRLTAADRRDVVAILRATKPDLPPYFADVTR
ncbi:MAG: hypothetical protein HOP14_15195 [Acidobacteria bacterium]|nr:hypothetical protein [Acidobacteriota bacterium]